MLSSEDHGIDHVSVSTPEGIRIASSNTIESLMEDDFRLVINDICYHVKTPKLERLGKVRESSSHSSFPEIPSRTHAKPVVPSHFLEIYSAFRLSFTLSIFFVQEELERLSDVKNLVHQLYEALNVEEHQLKKERELSSQLEELKVELEPMEQVRSLSIPSGPGARIMRRQPFTGPSGYVGFWFDAPTLLTRSLPKTNGIIQSE